MKRTHRAIFGAAWVALPLALIMTATTGCDQRSGASTSSEAKANPAAAVVGHGIVRGTVKFAGTPPTMKVIENQPCCAGAPKQLKEETVVVGPDGALANAVVWLKDGPAAGDQGASLPPATLDQKFCRFVPHVVAVATGQTLHIRSSDTTMHNVHWVAEKNPPENFAMVQAGADHDVTFAEPELIPVRCDVHPWMTATIAVIGTPFFAVTKDDGRFELTGVPAGTYTLAVWQEKYGELDQKVTVTDDGKPAAAAFEYKPPQ